MPSTPQTVLGSGEHVTFSPYFHHQADYEFYRVIREEKAKAVASGVVKDEDRVPVFIYLAAVEATLPLVIERIVKDGAEVAFSRAWLGKLHPADYQVLSDALVALRDELAARDEAGKKKD